MRTFLYGDDDAADFYPALLKGEPVVLKFASGVEVLFVLDGDKGRMWVAAPKACVWVTPETPSNRFELVRGGFPLDIAQGVIVYMQSAREANTDRPLEGQTNVPKLGHSKEED